MDSRRFNKTYNFWKKDPINPGGLDSFLPLEEKKPDFKMWLKSGVPCIFHNAYYLKEGRFQGEF